MNNKTIFFPAISGFVCAIFENDFCYKDKSFKFYGTSDKREKIFNYPYFLITAGHFYKKNIRKRFDINYKTSIVLGDSGGYQLATNVLKYSDKIVSEIFEWLENNTNYALNIDFPPYGKEGNHCDDNFKKKLEISLKNFEFFYKNKMGKTKFLNVLQGRSIKHLKLWWQGIKDFDFEGGLAIGSVGRQPVYNSLLSFFFLKERGLFKKYANRKDKEVKLLHFLGLTTIDTLMYIYYLQKKLNENNINLTISFDSSSYSLSASMGNYNLFQSLNGMSGICFTRDIKVTDLNHTEMPCKCPVCSLLTIKDLYKIFHEGNKSEFYYFLGMHNLYTFIQFKEKIENFINMGQGSFYKKILENQYKIFQLIDKCFESSNPLEIIEENRTLLGYNITNNKHELSLF